MSYKQGDLVFVDFPFDDETTTKGRPAIIVGKSKSRFNTYLVAKITSSTANDAHSFWLDNRDMSIPTPRRSQVKCNVIQTLSETQIQYKFSILRTNALRELCLKIQQNFTVD